MKTVITQLSSPGEIEKCAALIRAAFSTVAVELNLTRENAPTNPAFMSAEGLAGSLEEKKIQLFGLFESALDAAPDSGLNSALLAGCVALEKSPDKPSLYFIERLGVLPKKRHLGYGKQLMDFACGRAASLGGEKVSIAIVNENSRLKKWYETYGFTETGKRVFDHLPFTVCFMEKPICTLS